MAKRRKLAADNTFEKIETQDEIDRKQEEAQNENEDENDENNEEQSTTTMIDKEGATNSTGGLKLTRNKRRKLKKENTKAKRHEFLKKLEIQQEKMAKSGLKNLKISGGSGGMEGTETGDANDSKFSFNGISSFLNFESGKLQAKQAAEQQRLQGEKKKRLTSKKRAKLLTNEVQQLQNVFQHPVFQTSPLSAIQQHLTNKVKSHQMSKVTTTPDASTTTATSAASSSSSSSASSSTETKKKSRVKVKKPSAEAQKRQQLEEETTKTVGGKRKRNE